MEGRTPMASADMIEGSSSCEARAADSMHLYNAWLPPPVAEATRREAESFASVVRSVTEAWRPVDPDSVYSTLKWISLIEAFLRAKSEVSLLDIETLVNVGLEIFENSQNKLYAQVRWGGILFRLLKKYGRKISVTVQWRPFYDSLINTHFKRNTGPEGWRLRQRHFETVTSLVHSSRKFFPSGSASEIWIEFRSFIENPWHNSLFEGSGFLSLFLPMNKENEDLFTIDWVKECLQVWALVPNCHFWDSQWASIIARCIKSYKFLNWEQILPELFTKYLNMFEVPVSGGSGSYPFSLEVPRSTRFLFASKTGFSYRAISTSIVHLLKPGGTAQEHFERLANFLEQYYHPSNGGRWTYSLERFLRYLVIAFQKRLRNEQLAANDDKQAEVHLGKSERASFAKVVLKLIDRGQYSKNDSLAETVANALSILSYVEPSLMLPFIRSRFYMALETDTATHQLKTAVTSVAFATRAVLFASSVLISVNDELEVSGDLLDLLTISLSNALLGMDANDPPKTLVTMQLIGSIFSNLPLISDDEGPKILQTINYSEWIDEFFSRLFSLLHHLEPRSVLNEDANISTSSGTFLVENNHYFAMLEVVFGRLSKPLFMQSLKKISKFVRTNVLPGAYYEVGLLCCACVNANPQEATHHLIQPILMSIISTLKESPISGYGGNGISSSSFIHKATLSPALETSLEYLLKVLSITISYAGSALLPYQDKLKGVIASSFEAPSWKVNCAGDQVLRSLLGSLVLYYPTDQYKCYSRYPALPALEEWIQSKSAQSDNIGSCPTWHIPSNGELLFANELLDLHLRSALDDLLTICQTKLHSEAGVERDHLKVTLLRIFSSLQGVLSCLPDLPPLVKYGKRKDLDHDYFFIAGASGASVGSSELREKAVRDVHVACKYLLDGRSDDSKLLILMIRILDALGNVGSLENEEWSNHMQAWKLDSAATIEPACNFIVSSFTKGKKRPRWALIDKIYMQNTWRSSQSLHHKFRTDTNISPPEILNILMDDLLNLSLHNYETVRVIGSKSLLKLVKRWPSLITNCVVTLAGKLLDPTSPEHAILGSCAILASQTVTRHLVVDAKAFSSFILGLLSSSHHESLKSQKALTDLFIKYNIHFAGVPRSFFSVSSDQSAEFADLVSKVRCMCFETDSLHWRYNLMANRVLLLLALASRYDANLSAKIMGETTGHFLKNLNSQLPQSRMLAISALNSLLAGSRHKTSGAENDQSSGIRSNQTNIEIDSSLTKIFQEEGFFSNALNSLSHVHITTDTDGGSVKGNHAHSVQSVADKAITVFYFDFSASWPRTPGWASLLNSDIFYSNFARIFKRLIQECGVSVLLSLQNTLEEFLSAKERSKQCVAAEVMAGILHSDITGLQEAWDGWISAHFKKIISTSFVESVPEWAACIRYAVTGKGRLGIRVPFLRHRIIESLLSPLSNLVATNIVAKRYVLISAAFTEINPTRMSVQEIEYHNSLLKELLENMSHSSAQVREAIGVALAILCSNLRLWAHRGDDKPDGETTMLEHWVRCLVDRAHEIAMDIQKFNHFEDMPNAVDSVTEGSSGNTEILKDVKRMETILHFVISSLRSGRSSVLLDIIVSLLYPVIALQETSHKDLSMLAKVAFELLKWTVLPRPHLDDSLSVILCSVNDSNWRTRFASLTYLLPFMYRHTFVLSDAEKLQIWKCVEKLLVDSQVEVREHAAGVLASLLKGGDSVLIGNYRDRVYSEALFLHSKRKQRNWSSSRSIASMHGAVLALAASVKSVPYDMPSWLPDHVTLLARFISEPSPVKSTVTKAVAEFRRTHADTWIIQKDSFTEEQLEVLADTTSNSSYFA